MGGLKSTTTAGLSYETLDWNYSSIMASGMVVTQTNIDQSASTSTLQSRRFQQDRGVFVQEEVQLGDAVYAADVTDVAAVTAAFTAATAVYARDAVYVADADVAAAAAYADAAARDAADAGATRERINELLVKLFNGERNENI